MSTRIALLEGVGILSHFMNIVALWESEDQYWIIHYSWNSVGEMGIRSNGHSEERAFGETGVRRIGRSEQRAVGATGVRRTELRRCVFSEKWAVGEMGSGDVCCGELSSGGIPIRSRVPHPFIQPLNSMKIAKNLSALYSSALKKKVAPLKMHKICERREIYWFYRKKYFVKEVRFCLFVPLILLSYCIFQNYGHYSMFNRIYLEMEAKLFCY